MWKMEVGSWKPGVELYIPEKVEIEVGKKGYWQSVNMFCLCHVFLKPAFCGNFPTVVPILVVEVLFVQKGSKGHCPLTSAIFPLLPPHIVSRGLDLLFWCTAIAESLQFQF
jgi:hypothetical protein